jgi:ADP-ribosylglycohydrolase
LVGGAIGDALGSKYENQQHPISVLTDFDWKMSDDTQLTLATCEAIYNQKVDPAKVAAQFLTWFNQRRLTGLGASTLKALRELQLGGHWALVGRTGEYAAGNGAAMRIAPLAFKKSIDKLTIRDVCMITHKNEEAYVGALAIFYALQMNINENDFLEKISKKLPDTNVKDRLCLLAQRSNDSISEIVSDYPSSGYVVDSVPLALFAAQKYSL